MIAATAPIEVNALAMETTARVFSFVKSNFLFSAILWLLLLGLPDSSSPRQLV
jgi:hypothetical protein